MSSSAAITRSKAGPAARARLAVPAVPDRTLPDFSTVNTNAGDWHTVSTRKSKIPTINKKSSAPTAAASRPVRARTTRNSTDAGTMPPAPAVTSTARPSYLEVATRTRRSNQDMTVTRLEPTPSSGPVAQAPIALAPTTSRSERQSPTAEQALGPQLPSATAANALTTQPQSVVPTTVKVSRKRKTSHQKKRAAEEKSMRKQLTAPRALEFRTDRQSAKRLERAATPAVRTPVPTSDDSESELSSDSDGSSSSNEDSSRGPSRTPSAGKRDHRNCSYRTTHNRRRAPPRPASPMESASSDEDVDPEAVSLTSSHQ